MKMKLYCCFFKHAPCEKSDSAASSLQRSVFSKTRLKKIVQAGSRKDALKEFMEFALQNSCAFIKIHENFFRRSLWLS